MVTVRRARPEDVDSCVAVLQRLPGYFTPNTYDELREEFSAADAWVGMIDGEDVVGFVLTERRYPTTAEILFAAVVSECHGHGLGRALVGEAVRHLQERGVDVVEVKTLDARSDYEPYVRTRVFWEGQGFRQIDCIDPLPGWPPGNPAAIYVASLGATR
jgi:ribosomal protein S18 acetylase RimI-like enzyme